MGPLQRLRSRSEARIAINPLDDLPSDLPEQGKSILLKEYSALVQEWNARNFRPGKLRKDAQTKQFLETEKIRLRQQAECRARCKIAQARKEEEEEVRREQQACLKRNDSLFVRPSYGDPGQSSSHIGTELLKPKFEAVAATSQEQGRNVAGRDKTVRKFESRNDDGPIISKAVKLDAAHIQSIKRRSICATKDGSKLTRANLRALAATHREEEDAIASFGETPIGGVSWEDTVSDVATVAKLDPAYIERIRRKPVSSHCGSIRRKPVPGASTGSAADDIVDEAYEKESAPETPKQARMSKGKQSESFAIEAGETMYEAEQTLRRTAEAERLHRASKARWLKDLEMREDHSTKSRRWTMEVLLEEEHDGPEVVKSAGSTKWMHAKDREEARTAEPTNNAVRHIPTRSEWLRDVVGKARDVETERAGCANRQQQDLWLHGLAVLAADVRRAQLEEDAKRLAEEQQAQAELHRREQFRAKQLEIQRIEAERQRLLVEAEERQFRADQKRLEKWRAEQLEKQRIEAETQRLIAHAAEKQARADRQRREKWRAEQIEIQRIEAETQRLIAEELEEQARADRERQEARRRERMRDCAACLEEHDVQEVLQLPCGHWYCGDALNGAITNACTSHRPFQCCEQTIRPEHIQGRIGARNLVRYGALLEELQEANPVYCSRPSCATFLPARLASGPDVIRCPTCRHSTCRHCKRPAHANECQADVATQQARNLAQAQGWKACPRCRNMVEKSSGCMHMTCRCTASFCYRCGLIRGEGSPRCTCD